MNDDGVWLPAIAARGDVSPESVAMAHRSLQKIPPPIIRALAKIRASVSIWQGFPKEWDYAPYGHRSWDTCGGYWDASGAWAVVNAAWCRTQGHMDAVVVHELGHALSINVLPRPHRDAPFREAWKAGRDEIRRRWPDATEGDGMKVFDLHWTRGTQEVWAECFAWILGARACTHPAFGEVFADCLRLVSAEMDAIMGAA